MSSAARLAFVCPRFAEGATVGGAETLLKALAVRCAAAGRQVTFLTTCATNHFTWENTVPPGRRRVDNLEVQFFPVDANRDVAAFLRAQELISHRGAYTADDEMAWLKNSVNSEALYAHLREHADDYDRIIMGPYLFGLIYFASRICPQKTLLAPCLHDEGFAYIRAFREMFSKVAGILFNSEPECRLAGRLYDLSKNRCAVVGMGLNPFEAAPTAFAQRRGLTAPYLLYSGRREAGKGIPLLLDYLALFRQRTRQDLKLVLTGSGPVNPPPELAPHVLDAGFVAEAEKHEAMAGALVFCHPSTLESFGIVILESWLARTPALVHGGSAVLRDHCQKSNGGLWFHLYPEFEEALLLLLQKDTLRQAMGEAGRAYVLRNYTWPAIDQKLFHAIDGGNA